LWDVDSGQAREFRGHTDWVNSVALSSDCRHGLSGSADHTVRWWDLDKLACRAVFP
jgi:WD40 repeat protein